MDIHDKNLLIKVNFPFDLNTNKIYGEIPYGVKERKIQPHTKFQKAKWEFPAQKWIAISDKNHGIILVNKSKYGFSANKNGLAMSLLVTTHYPIGFYFSYIKTVPNKLRRKYIDLGKHEVKYALKFHKGNWRNAHPWKFGYEFNYPLISYSNKNQSIRTRKQKSAQKLGLQNPSSMLFNQNGLIEISEPNVILQTMKPPEFYMPNEANNKSLKPSRNKSIILRLFETAGMDSECIVKSSKHLQVKDAIEMDLLELEELQRDVIIRDNSSVVLHFNSFEIKTVKISFK